MNEVLLYLLIVYLYTVNPRYNKITLFKIPLNSKRFMVPTAVHSEQILLTFNEVSLITKQGSCPEDLVIMTAHCSCIHFGFVD